VVVGLQKSQFLYGLFRSSGPVNNFKPFRPDLTGIFLHRLITDGFFPMVVHPTTHAGWIDTHSLYTVNMIPADKATVAELKIQGLPGKRPQNFPFSENILFVQHSEGLRSTASMVLKALWVKDHIRSLRE